MRQNLFAFTLGLLFAGQVAAADYPDEWFFYPSDNPTQQKLNEIVGKQAPPLQVTDWKNGEVSAADMKGKIVVVDFWATWCGPCLGAIPHTNELMKKYADKGVAVVGVCTHSRGQEKMEEIAKQHNIEYPIARDPESRTAQAWGVRFYPTYAVIDRDGKVAAIGLRPDAVEKVIEKLLEAKAADAGAKDADATADASK